MKNISSFIFSLILGTFVVMSVGGWYHLGAVEYSMVNYTDFASYNQSSALFDDVDSLYKDDLLSNSTTRDFFEQFGFYAESVGDVFWGFISGDYLQYSVDYTTDLLGATELPVPLYIYTTISIILTMIILFAGVNILLGGSKQV